MDYQSGKTLRQGPTLSGRQFINSITDGSLSRGILRFSMPLILTNLIQVLFNMSDIAVVGRFAGPLALGAVGCTAQLVFLFTGIVIGVSSGMSVAAAFSLGAKDAGGVRRTVSSSLAVAVVMGAALLAAGMALSKAVLVAMNTKQELLSGALVYLRVYLLGMPSLALYNFAAAILQAGGDTKRPLVYLSISGVLNVALNLLCVIVFHLAEAGVAIASVISCTAAAILAMRAVIKERQFFTATDLKKAIQCDAHTASRVLRIGLPAALQNAVFAFANVFIQVGVNTFDATMVAGTAAASNADPIAYEVMGAFYTACATYIAQNYGAHKMMRVKRSYLISLGYAFAAGLAIGVGLFVFGRQFLSAFTTDTSVINCGMQRLSIMSFSYCAASLMDCTIAASRGLGHTFIPSIYVMIGSCAFRILWIKSVFAHFGTIQSLFLLYVFSWLITAVCEGMYFVQVLRKAK